MSHPHSAFSWQNYCLAIFMRHRKSHVSRSRVPNRFLGLYGDSPLQLAKSRSERNSYTGASLWEVLGVRHPPILRDCWQISKLSAFVGKCRIVGGVKEASIFMPILPTVSQLR